MAMTVHEGPTATELDQREAERILDGAEIPYKEIVRYHRGDSILYINNTQRAMTAWLTQLDDELIIATEMGFEPYRTDRATERQRTLHTRQSAQEDMDQA